MCCIFKEGEEWNRSSKWTTCPCASTFSTEKHESLKEYLLALVQGRLQYDEFYALKDVSLDIMPGDFYGLVGLNGRANPPCSRPLRACTPTRGKAVNAPSPRSSSWVAIWT